MSQDILIVGNTTPNIVFSEGTPPQDFCRFEPNGDVFLFDEALGEMRKIDVDKELAQCFTVCISKLVKGDVQKVIKRIKELAIEQYKEEQKLV